MEKFSENRKRFLWMLLGILSYPDEDACNVLYEVSRTGNSRLAFSSS